MLAGYRVLDLADGDSCLCGRILGDLGADVIKVERPGGDQARNKGPFFHDTRHPEKSLYWFALNASKRGITLDIEAAEGQDVFRALAKRADAVVESFPPGHLGKLGLDYASLVKLNPGLIMASISPFGQSGPYAHYKAPDIVTTAMSGFMYVCGDADRPPLRISWPQSYLHAAADAAAGIVAALYHRGVSDEGQHIDVSVQESSIWNMMGGHLLWEAGQVNPRRMGTYQQISPQVGRRMIWPCKDGYVCWAVYTAPAYAAGALALVKWMDEEGMAPDFLKNVEWAGLNMQAMTEEEFQRLGEPIGRFFLRYTREEIYEQARKRRVILSPMHATKEVLEDAQLRARDFWQEVEHPELDAVITYPGSFSKTSDGSVRIRRRAPLVGEHNEEVYVRELGFSTEQLLAWKRGKVV